MSASPVLTTVLAALAAVGPSSGPASCPVPSPEITAIGRGEASVGSPAAPIKVIEYAALACKGCFQPQAGPSLGPDSPLVTSGLVRYVFRPTAVDAAGVGLASTVMCLSESEVADPRLREFGKARRWASGDDPRQSFVAELGRLGFGGPGLSACSMKMANALMSVAVVASADMPDRVGSGRSALHGLEHVLRPRATMPVDPVAEAAAVAVECSSPSARIATARSIAASGAVPKSGKACPGAKDVVERNTTLAYATKSTARRTVVVNGLVIRHGGTVAGIVQAMRDRFARRAGR